jgi:Methyltransferase domain
MQSFENTLNIQNGVRVLDVGGNQFNWQFVDHHCSVVVVNLEKPKEWDDQLIDFTFEQGDGTKLKYASRSFDIVYSNSVIEHLGTWENQIAFAEECSRVGKGVWVQTPAKSFLVEPHLITPFIHWLPTKWQPRLMRNFTVWGIITRPTQQFIKGFLQERRLLTYGEMKILFPDCRILKERFFGMTKSYIAFRSR